MSKKVILLILVLLFMLTSCDEESKSSTNNDIQTIYTVVVDGEEQKVLAGEKAVKPNLEKDGFILDGFTCDGIPFDWNTPINENLIISSNWTPIVPPEEVGFQVSLTIGNATSYWEA